jgi:hypothetical protein
LSDSAQCLLIAADIETLKDSWEKINPFPLQEDGIQKVAIFSEDAITK